MNQLEVSRREICIAKGVANRLPGILGRRKLEAVFEGFYVTRYQGMTLLFAVLDTERVGYLEKYADARLLHQISTELGGMRVYLSNSTGLRFVFLLSNLPTLPKSVLLPEVTDGRVAIGVTMNGTLAWTWERMGHLLVAGQTGSGKSVFLRGLAYQALRDGMRLLVADLDGSTFPMLAGHGALLAPIADTPLGALELVQTALGECDRRAKLFGESGGFPEKLSEYNAWAVKMGVAVLPRVLVILDEFSAIATAVGDSLRLLVAQLGWRGRKFGVSVVFAAQEFTKALTGPVREQVGSVICFRVRSGEMAARIGCAGAETIPVNRPGLAITDRWGLVQTYYTDKGLLLNGVQAALTIGADERVLFERVRGEYGGRIGRALVMELAGVSEWRARTMLEGWAMRGWVEKDARLNNSFVIALKLLDLLSNAPTSPMPPTGVEVIQPVREVAYDAS